MKRYVALALALILLLSTGMASAGYGCRHSNKTLAWSDHDVYLPESWSNNDEEHLSVVIYHLTCNDCGCDVTEMDEKWEPHTFEQRTDVIDGGNVRYDYCTGCGASFHHVVVEGCSHRWEDMYGCSNPLFDCTVIETWYEYTKNVDEDRHTEHRMRRVSCNACGEIIEKRDMGYASEACSFVKGVCSKCGNEDPNYVPSELVSEYYSGHPHYVRTDVYSDGRTVDVKNREGYKLSRELCDECYPVDFNTDTLQEMAQLAMAAYETRDLDPSDYPEYLKDAVRYDDIDCLVIPQMTADGKLCLTLSFEGTKEWMDLIRDLRTEMNQYGMHTGIAHDFGVFINEHIEELFPLLNRVRESGGSIQITGHSYGGGMTQLMVNWLLTQYDFPNDRLVAYTFASPVVLSDAAQQDERLKGAHVYNIINVNDLITKVGITTEYEKWWCIFEPFGVAVEESVDLLMNTQMGGGKTLSGYNLGTNYYLSGVELDDDAWQSLMDMAGNAETEEEKQQAEEEIWAFVREKASNLLSCLLQQHSMELYQQLIEAAIAGEQEWIYDQY